MTKKDIFASVRAANDQGLYVCAGFDTRLAIIPQSIIDEAPLEDKVSSALFTFNRLIFDAIRDKVAAIKLNSAFYEAEGPDGWAAMFRFMNYVRATAPHVLIIWDAKREDIGSTCELYVEAAKRLKAHALTIGNYVGKTGLSPFLDSSLGCFVLCRTSNPDSDELQGRRVYLTVGQFNKLVEGPYGNYGSWLGCPRSLKLFEFVALRVANHWNGGNCGLVAGATYPVELKRIRQLVGLDMPLLIPGIGKQGGDIEKTLHYNSSGTALINLSSGITQACSSDDMRERVEAAVAVVEGINQKVREFNRQT